MRTDVAGDFPLDPALVMLNHASYGVPTRRTLDEAGALRAEIEADSNERLGAELTTRLREQSALVARTLGLSPGSTTLCTNATSGAAAVIEAVDLSPGATVAVLDSEYSSICRAWEHRCARAGASFVRVPVPLPLRDTGDLLARLAAAVPGDVAFVQVSLVSSSAALALPVAAVSEWTRRRGGRLIVDAAHGPGHVPVVPVEGVDAMFGTLHKWFPTMRPVGFLWASEEFRERLRPAEVSLTWDSSDLVERFSWPGTFDPVPRLTAGSAVGQWRDWKASGALDRCEALAAQLAGTLTELGAVPTGAPPFTPPRLRAFVLPGLRHEAVKAALRESGLRVWTGPGPRGECLLRISTHVYNDEADAEALAARVREIRGGTRGLTGAAGDAAVPKVPVDADAGRLSPSAGRAGLKKTSAFPVKCHLRRRALVAGLMPE
ncbi:hypothetical protein BJF79_24105 [Actinomadura sp. CNU-125]|uniref:aminotransferase class V-fold PLP-dependent enzyme n=1 Tax=Actinomadura sp. CNU-125 TaxID=1904961 RepID=UPI000959DF9C|nr:aminotransferase class V-fold PLP-dependent enzyme [Actinomadura sp. CNU-125]OLT11415.1 hypothetical protein BJF79_24105 [Actinomadura sp. CNU-125]